MPIFDTHVLRDSLSFTVSDDELEAFEPQIATPGLAGSGCGNIVCRNI